MSGPAAPASPPEADPAAPVSARPIAVVWCRQVDNEEESPGYTTIPEQFPGQKETVETVRIVGNLAINVADTTDYWDPEPGTPLSYYPNLFLYPAYRGEYTCVGRMFLSKEDRPRLGMKTLVLPTAELLQPEGFGPAVLRWHASMGGPRPVGPLPSANPDPALYELLGEGFLFHRGATDPLLVVASERWAPAMQVLLDLLGGLPSAISALGGILAFPYFLPKARVDMKDLTERLPLTLAIMRVPRSEASGPRHERRIESWEGSNVTVRDLAGPAAPPTAGKGKEPHPLVLQYIRDHEEAKLVPIRQRVDLVELPRLRVQLAQGDPASGRARRKESWRIGTAMESAALLLLRSRGRHVPVSAETAKRAQAYLNVSTAGLRPGDPDMAAVVPAGAGERDPAPLPPRRADEPPRPLGSRPAVESVPVPTRDDPSLRPIPPDIPMLGLAVPKEGSPPVSGPEENELRAWIRAEVALRLGEAGAPIPAEGAPGLGERVDRIERELAGKLAAGGPSASGAPEGRLAETIRQQQLVVTSLREELLERIETTETKMRNSFASALAPEIDRRVRQAVEPKLAEAVRVESERARQAAMTDVERAIAEMHERLRSAEEETRASLTSQLDRHLREAADRELTIREATEGRLKEALQRQLAQSEERLTSAGVGAEELDERVRAANAEFRTWLEGTPEAAGAVETLVDGRLQAWDEARAAREASRETERSEAQTQALADLQVRLERHIEDRIRETSDAERTKFVELFARLKREVDQSVTEQVKLGTQDAALLLRLDASIAERQKEALHTLDEHLATAEERLRVEQSEGVQRLEQIEAALADRGAALARLESSVRAELDELDHRTQLLTDRLIPVVRKAWLKIAELQQAPEFAGTSEPRLVELHQELLAETRRLDGELERRTAEIRHRVDSAIAHQGRIWLTLIHHLKELTDQRSLVSLGLEEEPPAAAAGPAELAAHDPRPPPIVTRREPALEPAPPPPPPPAGPPMAKPVARRTGRKGADGGRDA
jgi:hypothetical protein